MNRPNQKQAPDFKILVLETLQALVALVEKDYYFDFKQFTDRTPSEQHAEINALIAEIRRKQERSKRLNRKGKK